VNEEILANWELSRQKQTNRQTSLRKSRTGWYSTHVGGGNKISSD